MTAASPTPERYQVVRRLDSGGMAEVYQGLLTTHGVQKPVAIKRVLPHLARNEKFMKMFVDEARLSMRLSHANIVQMFDLGKSNDTYFLVMEFIDGANLKSLLEHARNKGIQLRAEHAIWIMGEVCKGLDYAHGITNEEGENLGIVHRDISPPNILLSRRGEVKIVDFGLAKATTQLEKTDPGVVKGKFSYLSPEVAHGEEPDHRSDIFAVGILLFELLTGKRLFYGESDFDTVQLVRQARVPRPSAIDSSIPEDLERVMMKALAKNKHERYQSAAELGNALLQYLFGHGLMATAFDIAKLVQEVLAKEVKAPESEQSFIDALIQEELVKFTSLDEGSPHGAPSNLSPTGANDGAAPLDASSFEDPRAWDLGDSIDGNDPVPRRDESLTATGRPRTLPPPDPGRPISAPAPRQAPVRTTPPTRTAGTGAQPQQAASGRPDAREGGSGTSVLLVTILILVLLAGGAYGAHLLDIINLPFPK